MVERYACRKQQAEKNKNQNRWKSDMLQAFFCYFSVGTSKYRRNLRLGEKNSIKSAKGTTNSREAF